MSEFEIPLESSQSNPQRKSTGFVRSAPPSILQRQKEIKLQEWTSTMADVVILTGKIEDLKNELRNLRIDSKKESDALNKEIEELKEELKSKTNRITELEEEMKGLKSDIKILRSDMENMNSWMGEMKSRKESMYRIISGQLSQQIQINICRYVLPLVPKEQLQHCNVKYMEWLIKKKVKPDEVDEAWKRYHYITMVLGLTEDHLNVMEYIREIRNNEAHPLVEEIELPTAQQLEDSFDAYFSAEDYESLKEMLKKSDELLQQA